MPVLALAIVIEARATIQRWSKNIPRAVKAIQGILWCAPLVIFWWAEGQAFSELAGTPVPHYWVTISQSAIAASLSILIITPMVGLLAATNARIIAGGFFSIRNLRGSIRLLRLARDIKKEIKRNERICNDFMDQLRDLDSLEATFLSKKESGDALPPEVLTNIISLRAEINAKLAEAKESSQRLRDYQIKATDFGSELSRVRKAYIESVEEYASGKEVKLPEDLSSSDGNLSSGES
jgi:hypothetical protein